MNVYQTPMNTKHHKESLFKNSMEHKLTMLDDIDKIHKLRYGEHKKLNLRYSSWLRKSTIGGGPPIVTTTTSSLAFIPKNI